MPLFYQARTRHPVKQLATHPVDIETADFIVSFIGGQRFPWHTWLRDPNDSFWLHSTKSFFAAFGWEELRIHHACHTLCGFLGSAPQ
jgi:hypothetical protein